MNWDRIEGMSKQVAGHARRQWGRMTHNALDIVAGNQMYEAGKAQCLYGIAKEEANRRLRAWRKPHKEQSATAAQSILSSKQHNAKA